MPSPKYFKCNVLLDIYFLLEVVTRNIFEVKIHIEKIDLTQRDCRNISRQNT